MAEAVCSSRMLLSLVAGGSVEVVAKAQYSVRDGGGRFTPSPADSDQRITAEGITWRHGVSGKTHPVLLQGRA